MQAFGHQDNDSGTENDRADTDHDKRAERREMAVNGLVGIDHPDIEIIIDQHAGSESADDRHRIMEPDQLFRDQQGSHVDNGGDAAANERTAELLGQWLVLVPKRFHRSAPIWRACAADSKHASSSWRRPAAHR